MPNPSNDDSIEFRKCLARIKHLEKMVARYSQVEAWENFKEGDRVLVDNSDSKHDGMIGNFIGHDWSASGYVRLVVGFNDGYKCYYLPTQLTPVFDETPPSPPPVETVAEPEVIPPPPKVQFKKFDPEAAQLENQAIIEAKLAQVAKMPKAARRGILKGGLDSALVPVALKEAIERGLIDK